MKIFEGGGAILLSHPVYQREQSANTFESSNGQNHLEGVVDHNSINMFRREIMMVFYNICADDFPSAIFHK